jgi:hypothetical protein
MANVWRGQPSYRLGSRNFVQTGAINAIALQFFEVEAGDPDEAIGSASHIISLSSVGVGHARVNGAGASALTMASASSGLASVPGQHATTLPALATAALAMSGIVGQASHTITVSSYAGGGSASGGTQKHRLSRGSRRRRA